jgi:transposase
MYKTGGYKMSKNTKREQRKYTEEYKVEAIKLARQLKDNKKTATELGLPESTLSTWLKKAELGEIDTGKGTQTPDTAMTQAAEIQKLEAEIKKIEKENERLREINEFLEEASAFFAASRQKLAKKSV